MRKNLLIFTLSISVLLFCVGSLIYPTSESIFNNQPSSGWVYSIDTISEFKSSFPKYLGSGTEEDPFIIENLEINANGGQGGIYLNDLNAYIILRGIKVTHSGTTNNFPEGISIVNCKNIQIIDCEILDFYDGIELYNVENATIKQNIFSVLFKSLKIFDTYNSTIHDNIIQSSAYGIYMERCSFNEVWANNLTSVDWWTIYTNRCHNMTISSNLLVDNGFGIYTKASYFEEITDNIISSSSGYGIISSESENITIMNNSINSAKFGITISTYSYNNTVKNNSISDMSSCGLEISKDSSDNILKSNNVTLSGISILNSSNTVDTTNLINGKKLGYFSDEKSGSISSTDNFGQLILNNCSNFLVEELNITNSNTGLYLYNCDNVIVFNCTFSNNTYGILASNSKDCVINSTLLEYNTVAALDLSNTNRTSVHNNSINNNYKGISWSNSFNNSFTNNSMIKSKLDFGFYSLINSTNNQINESNTMDGNPIYYYENQNDFIIDETNQSNCIYLMNCSFFDIKNLDISHTNVNLNVIGCSNFTFSDSNFTDTGTCSNFNFYRSANGTLKNNILDGISGDALYFENCSDLIVEKNTVNDSSEYGIYANYSNNLSICNNSVSNCAQDCIYCFDCDNTTIKNNSVSYAMIDGISLKYSNYCNVTQNHVTNIKEDGVYLYLSDYCRVQNNSIENTNHTSIHLYYSDYNEIYGNKMACGGIFGQNSDDNTYDSFNTHNNYRVYVLQNEESITLSNLGQVGQIILLKCEEIKIQNFEISNGAYGLVLSESTDITIQAGDFNICQCGLYMDKSSEISVSSCTFSDMTYYGIYSSECNDCIINNNQFHKCWLGIRLYEVSSNEVRKNSFYDMEYAIYLSFSDYVEIKDNNIEVCEIGIYGYSSDWMKILGNNYREIAEENIIIKGDSSNTQTSYFEIDEFVLKIIYIFGAFFSSLLALVKFPELKKEQIIIKPIRTTFVHAKTQIPVIEEEIEKKKYHIAEKLLKTQESELLRVYIPDFLQKYKDQRKNIQKELKRLNNLIITESEKILASLKNNYPELEENIKQELEHPQLKSLEIKIEELNNLKIFCKENNLDTLFEKLEGQKQLLSEIRSKIIKVFDLHKNAIDSFNEGYYLAGLEHLKESAKILENTSLEKEKRENYELTQKFKIKIKTTIKKVDEMLDSLKITINKSQVEKSRRLFDEMYVLYHTLGSDFILKNTIYDRHILMDKFKTKIVSLENEEKVFKIMVEFANKYPRVHLLEIVNITGLNPNRCEKIIKKLINKKKIKGKFDDISKGIDFEFATDEIEMLTKAFENWENQDGKKTS